MTTPAPAEPADPKADPGKPATPGDPDDTGQGADEKSAQPEEAAPQRAWDTLRDIGRHAPASARFTGRNNGVVAGEINGNVTRNEHHYYGASGPTRTSGEVPAAELDRLALTFVSDGTPFEELLERLLEERVLVLTGVPFTGRRTAALMLLRRAGATPVHAIDRETRPSALLQQLTKGEAPGHVLCDLVTSRDEPLRETHLLSLRDHLLKHGGHLVITTGLRPWIEDDVRTRMWEAPRTDVLLRSRLERRTGEAAARRLLELAEVQEFLPRAHQPREVVAYAAELMRFASGEIGEEALRDTSSGLLDEQVREWFEADEDTLHLREKAFLIALAAFDAGPYALTAELSDLLFQELQATANSKLPKTVPVFGTHIAHRLRTARARHYPAREMTEWGPVEQLMAEFLDSRTAFVLLREVWTGHPSARPALVSWLGELIVDGRPFVRTRAAATVGALAFTDLPSAMALVIAPWAVSRSPLQRVGAVSSLALAHRVGAPNILRIADDWTADSDLRLSWVGIRVQGLLGAERPREALAALRVQARKQYDPEKPGPLESELAQSVELLLLSPEAEDVLSEVLRTLDDHRSVFRISVSGFLGACRHTEEESGLPLVLRTYRQTRLDGTPAAHGIPRLWRAALDDPSFTAEALDVLRGWVLAADRDEDTSWALADLLPKLVDGATAAHRIGHLLHTVRGDDGGPRPAAADDLLTALHRA
ncbi:hypothetical protein [Streptomyces sp. SPB4]|uniref:hypothetical protein n=1 Tax=Streptomyces sp. SPB4 TaxID=2940553 RepID=UPI00247609F2|nr:hypothetical protein [Streptomyces sp. SPB4]MDH6541471.1 hypothetical protein [Streptomyces sp. SPB4]